MMKTHIPTITVGVAAHNESENILYLLRSILKQKGPSFNLKEVIVISDGSTDNTPEKLAVYSKKHPIIKVISETQRKGKISRVRQIFSLAEGDYIFIFDADVILSGTNVIEKMMASFTASEKVALVSAYLKPLPVSGISAKITSSWINIWNKISQNYNNGDLIYNAQAAALGIRSSLAKHVIFPKIVTDEAAYLYLLAKSRHLLFSFAPDALVLYRIPQTISDYIKKIKRTPFEKNILIPLFGVEVNEAYQIPFLYKSKIALIAMLKNPFNILIIPFFSFLKLLPYSQDTTNKDHMWTFPSPRKSKVHSY